MNKKYLEFSIWCFCLSMLLSMFGLTCLYLSQKGLARQQKAVEKTVTVPDSLSKPVVTYSGALDKITFGFIHFDIWTDKGMNFTIIENPEVSSKGDSVLIYEYGPDKPRYARICPYQKLYRLVSQ